MAIDMNQELVTAIIQKNIAAVKNLLKQGVSPDPRYAHEVSSLATAAGKGHTEIVKLLLDYRADINRPDNNGNVPLLHAAVNGQEDVVRLLLDRMADFDIPTKNGHTIRYLAEQRNLANIVRMLDAEPARRQSKLGVRKEQYPGSEERQATEAFIVAIINGDISLTEMFLKMGVDPNGKHPDKKFTPLTNASQNGHNHIVQLLLDYGARVNEPDDYGVPPLLGAASKDFRIIARMLLEAGADPDQMVNNKKTVRALTMDHRKHDILKIMDAEDEYRRQNGQRLSQAKPKIPFNIKAFMTYQLTLAAARGDLATMRNLIANGADINGRDHHDNTPLMMAVSNQRLPAIEYLLEMGAEIGIKREGKQTARDLAFILYRDDIVELLDTTDAARRKAIHAAAEAAAMRQIEENQNALKSTRPKKLKIRGPG